MRAAGLPSALVLAGTTALPALLHDCDSSFWSRLDDNALPLGLLLNQEAGSEVIDAIFTPMSEAGREVDDAVRRLAVEANGLIWHPDQGRQDRWTQGIPTLSAYACRMFATNHPAVAKAISDALNG